MKKDELGERMKRYENITRQSLPPRTYTVIRLDGKAFHTYTKGFARPYDTRLMRVMDNTAIALMERLQHVRYAYVQSDEISILMSDFDNIHTDAWFKGNIQKIVSVSASIATAHFNNGMYLDEEIMANMDKIAYFDSRVWTIPDRNEVFNYFLWRQQDATRNSIQMGAQKLYKQKELDGKDTSELQELMWQKGQNWNDYPVGFKRGRVIIRDQFEVSAMNKKTGLMETTTRNKWISAEPPIFSQDKNFLGSRTPKLGETDGSPKSK